MLHHVTSLEGRVALVTGASRGIGYAIARELAARGARVAANYHQSEPPPELNGSVEHRLAIAVRGDVSNLEDVRAVFSRVEETLGPVEILVNNAGITRDKSFAKMLPEQWRDVLDVNLSGIFNCCHVAVPGMMQRGYGRIVSISSVVADTGAFGQANYAASKSGILGFTRALAQEVARHGITVNAVSPGYIETQMVAAMPENVIGAIRERIPMRRLGRPEEIAATVRFLVEEGDYITGSTVRVNGGLFGG